MIFVSRTFAESASRVLVFVTYCLIVGNGDCTKWMWSAYSNEAISKTFNSIVLFDQAEKFVRVDRMRYWDHVFLYYWGNALFIYYRWIQNVNFKNGALSQSNPI